MTRRHADTVNARAFSRRFLVAVLVSLLLHVVLISGAWLRVPGKIPDEPPLEARLMTRATPPPPPPEVKPKPRRKPPARHAAPKQPPAPPAVAAATPLALPPEPDAVLPPDETAEPALSAPAPSNAEESAPAAPAPERAPPKILPRKGRITYTLYLGSDKFSVGKTVQSWEVDGDAYRLGSVSETTGIAELFRAQRLVYLSEGRLTARGLQPETFLMSRTRRGRTEEAQAQFDWETGTVTLGKAANRRGMALTADSQDMVSFMYQIALAPPAKGRIQLPVTNGSNLETYDLEVLSEEQIETPLGKLKALPVKQVRRPGAESIEIWFAVEYHYLPVKIRFFDREGDPAGEQIVNDIRISQE